MQVVRKILKGTELKNVIDIPSNLINKKLELLIIPIEEDEQKRKRKNKKSLSGFLAEYANANLISKESDVWYIENNNLGF